MESVAREEGYEAGVEDSPQLVTTDKAVELIQEYGLSVNAMDSERMKLTCHNLFEALTKGTPR
jgi:hypothetical protein